MSNIIVFVNHVGQTVIAEQVSDNANSLVVKNPAVLHVTPNQTGQLQVQLIPLFFKEFIEEATRNDGSVFTFSKNSIVTSAVKLEPKISEQYVRIFTPAKPVNEGKGKDAPVIKLFDE
jgi:hypothetical protein